MKLWCRRCKSKDIAPAEGMGIKGSLKGISYHLRCHFCYNIWYSATKEAKKIHEEAWGFKS